MSTNERVRGVQVYRPIIYGSHARLLSEEEKETAPPGHTHRWTVFLTSATSPPPPAPTSSNDAPPTDIVDMDYLPGGADDLSYLIKKVTFRLHDTYTNPARVFDKPPFKVTETGWGEFTPSIRIQFIPESGEKPMTILHPIKLHHWGPPIEPPPQAILPKVDPSEPAAGIAGEESAIPTPTPNPVDSSMISIPVDGPKDGSTEVKLESNINAEAGPSNSTSNPVQPPEPTGSITATPLPPTSESIIVEETTPLLASITVSQPLTPISIANRYPVHSWQYDELVFSDPPQSLLNIMNEHPPTALPPKNRRSRDQREEHVVRKGKKGRRSDATLGRSDLLEQLSAATGPGSGPEAGGSGAGAGGLSAIQVGIRGEPGSADVPLEFSQEMEKGEWNRLNEARIRIVEEMDSWRERLIIQEKELARVKDEMKA